MNFWLSLKKRIYLYESRIPSRWCCGNPNCRPETYADELFDQIENTLPRCKNPPTKTKSEAREHYRMTASTAEKLCALLGKVDTPFDWRLNTLQGELKGERQYL